MHRGPISLATHKNPIGLLCFSSDRQKIRPLIVSPEHTANFFITVTPLTRIIIILYLSIFIYYQLVYYIYMFNHLHPFANQITRILYESKFINNESTKFFLALF